MLYTVLSNVLAITGVTLIPLKSAYSTGVSTLGSGLMLASFQRLGQLCRARDKFPYGKKKTAEPIISIYLFVTQIYRQTEVKRFISDGMMGVEVCEVANRA